MSENKFTTYFLYAVGEIILVVIGILIAIQIDHWNENRKQRKIERAYLSEISSKSPGRYRTNQHGHSI